MNVSSIYDLVQYIVNKDSRGLAFTIDQYNLLFKSTNYDVLNDEVKTLFPTQYTPVGNDVISHSKLNPFVTTSVITAAGNKFELPTDYVRWCSLITRPSTTMLAPGGGGNAVATGGTKVTMVSSQNYAEAQSSVYARPDVEPVAKFVGKYIVPLPTTMQVIEMDYIRKPVEPYYDYCQNGATYDPIFMPVGSQIVGSNLMLNGSILASNVIKDGVTLPYTSQTVEPEWEEYVYPEIVSRMLSKVGINLSSIEVTKLMEGK